MKKQQNQRNNLESQLEEVSIKKYRPVLKARGGKAVIYTRVSSLEQQQNNGSLEVQKKHCETFCEQNGIIIFSACWNL